MGIALHGLSAGCYTSLLIRRLSTYVDEETDYVLMGGEERRKVSGLTVCGWWVFVVEPLERLLFKNVRDHLRTLSDNARSMSFRVVHDRSTGPRLPMRDNRKRSTCHVRFKINWEVLAEMCSTFYVRCLSQVYLRFMLLCESVSFDFIEPFRLDRPVPQHSTAPLQTCTTAPFTTSKS